MCEVVKKKHCFPKKTLFSPKTHCFPTCAVFYPIVLKRKIITAWKTNAIYALTHEMTKAT